jgi:acyl-CoA synthetase (AMP-forming)/AMP-acid ligase II/thioesterase domain-containing protein
MSSSGYALEAERPGPDRFLHLRHWAEEAPAATALAAPGYQPLSYSRLWNHLETTRQALRAAGVQPGQIVTLVTRQGPEALSAYLAIAGEFACAPLNPALTEVEFRSHLSRLGARTLLVQDDLAPQSVAIARELGIGVARISIEPQHAAGEFIIASIEMPSRPGRAIPGALILHTSATTGRPKLVPLSQANLQALALASSRAAQLSATDRLLSVMPMFHLHGLSSASAQLIRGGAVICTSGFDAGRFQDWLDEFSPTWGSFNPAILRVILALRREHPELLHRWPFRFVRTGGAAAEPWLVTSFEELFRTSVLDSYGMTEASGITRERAGARKPGSVGQSIGLEIAILDDSGRNLPAEAEGEIAVRGATVTSGYLDDPEANRIAFQNGWFHTGDIGRLDMDGFLYITGRKKEMINRGGQKIFPTEVDQALARHPAVLEAAAFAVSHPTLGEDLAAAVVLRPGASATEPDLRRFLGTQLAAYKIPRSIVFLENMPRTASGKLKRAHLAEQIGRAREIPAAAPQEVSLALQAIQSKLLDIWSRILEAPEIGIQDDFFGLGGDSLSAALMLAETEKALHISRGALGRVELFDNLTIQGLARILLDSDACTEPRTAANASHACDILPFRTGGSRIPFFCFPASSLDPFYLRHLAKNLGQDQPFYVVAPPAPDQGSRLLKVEDVAAHAISAIRSVRPHGPYLIGGHCYGGVLAFEAARRLLAEGEQLAPLVLLDVPAPGYPKIARNWRRYLTELRRLAASWARRERAFRDGEVLSHLHRLKRLAARRFRGQAGRAMSRLGSQDRGAWRGQQQLNSLALAEYVLKDFAAPILHLVAADEAVSTRVLDDPRCGWRDFARGGLESRRVCGGHNSMLSAANAPGLAAEIHGFLDRARLSAAFSRLPERHSSGSVQIL